MSIRSALLAGLAALIMVLALGNPPIVEEISDDEDPSITLTSIVAPVAWDDGEEGDNDDLGPLILRAATFVVAAAVLGGLAGRARKGAAFVAGWGVAFLAAGLGGVVYSLTVEEVGELGFSESPGALDKISLGTHFSLGFGLALWLGWIIGLAVMIGARTGLEKKANIAGPVDGPGAPAWTAPTYSRPSDQGAPSPGAADSPWAPPGSPGAIPGTTPPPTTQGPAIGPPPDRSERTEPPPS